LDEEKHINDKLDREIEIISGFKDFVKLIASYRFPEACLAQNMKINLKKEWEEKRLKNSLLDN
jgi:hypothetical protein